MVGNGLPKACRQNHPPWRGWCPREEYLRGLRSTPLSDGPVRRLIDPALRSRPLSDGPVPREPERDPLLQKLSVIVSSFRCRNSLTFGVGYCGNAKCDPLLRKSCKVSQPEVKYARGSWNGDSGLIVSQPSRKACCASGTKVGSASLKSSPHKFSSALSWCTPSDDDDLCHNILPKNDRPLYSSMAYSAGKSPLLTSIALTFAPLRLQVDSSLTTGMRKRNLSHEGLQCKEIKYYWNQVRQLWQMVERSRSVGDQVDSGQRSAQP
nr:hypothetical protein Iba_chr02bCG2750 [Ipomoea batatas]